MTNVTHCDKLFGHLKKCAHSSADRVPGYEPVGRGFESPWARQSKKDTIGVLFALARGIRTGSVVNDSLGWLSEPSLTERRRDARIRIPLFCFANGIRTGSVVNDSLGWLSEPSLTERRRDARIRIPQTLRQNTARCPFCFGAKSQ